MPAKSKQDAIKRLLRAAEQVAIHENCYLKRYDCKAAKHAIVRLCMVAEELQDYKCAASCPAAKLDARRRGRKS